MTEKSAAASAAPSLSIRCASASRGVGRRNHPSPGQRKSHTGGKGHRSRTVRRRRAHRKGTRDRRRVGDDAAVTPPSDTGGGRGPCSSRRSLSSCGLVVDERKRKKGGRRRDARRAGGSRRRRLAGGNRDAPRSGVRGRDESKWSRVFRPGRAAGFVPAIYPLDRPIVTDGQDRSEPKP